MDMLSQEPDSNRQPPVYKTGALPIELSRLKNSTSTKIRTRNRGFGDRCDTISP